jgi:hypothetical protein
MLPATFSDQHPAPSSNASANRLTLGGTIVDHESGRWAVTSSHIDLGASGGREVARKGDKVIVNGAIGEIIEGSSKVYAA